VIVRCTRKLLSLLHPGAPRSLGSLPADDDDWYANLLWISRRKCLLITHAGTLFSVFAPDVHAAEVRPLGRFFVPLIEAELKAEGLPVDTFGTVAPDQVVVARTIDRSVLGCMNDMALVCESVMASSGGLERCDVADLNQVLRRNINSVRGYVPPIELAALWADRQARPV